MSTPNEENKIDDIRKWSIKVGMGYQLYTEYSDLLCMVAHGLDDLPILARLEMAKNLVCDNGGEDGEGPLNPVCVLVGKILRDVIEVLGDHPEAAQLRRPDDDKPFSERHPQPK